MRNSSFHKLQFEKNVLNVKLLQHFFFTGCLFPHLSPPLASSAKAAHLINQKEEIWEDVEALEVTVTIFVILEKFLSKIKLKSHKREMIHKEHESKNSTYQSSDIWEKLVNFIERPFINSRCTWLQEKYPCIVIWIDWKRSISKRLWYFKTFFHFSWGIGK